MSIYKKHWRLALIVMIVGLLAFGTAITVLADDAPDRPTNCPTPEIELGEDNEDDPDWFTSTISYPGLGAQDPKPDKLPLLENCDEYGWLKIDGDQDFVTTGYYELGDPKTYGTDDGFRVYIWNDGDTFTWLSNYPVYYVYAKGGNQGGNMYIYDPPSTSGCGLSQPGGDWSHINFYYCVPQYGCLEITKDWIYPDGFTDLFPDYVGPTSIEVEVSGPHGYSETWTLTPDGEGNWSHTECDLLTGTYSIVEVDVPGYSATYDPVSMEVSVEADATATITIENTPDLGCLEILKDWEYPDGFLDLFPNYVGPTSIEVEVSGPYGYEETWTLTENDDWEKLVCGLLPGTYSIVEVDVPGYSATYDPVSMEVSVEADATATITIENTPDLGCLKITKEWVYPDSEDLDGPYFPVPDNIEVQITGPYGYDETFMLKAANNWTKTICDLVPGYYTAEELGEIEGYVTVYDPDPPTVEVLADAEEAIEILIINYALFGDDTIWAYSAYAYDELEKRGEEVPSVVYHNNKVDGNNSNAWGWTNFINDVGTYDFYLFAGAGQNDTERGTNVGTLTVEVERCDEEDAYFATVNYNVSASILAEYHLWVGDTPLPLVRRGNRWVPTAAPGQFPYGDGAVVQVCLEEGFYVAAHGVVRMPYTPDL